MKEILFALLCFILFMSIVLAILFHERIRTLRKKMKQVADAREARKMAEEDEYFKRTSNKYYRKDDTPKFKDGYFKSSDTPKDKQPREPQQETTTCRTTTDGGVTIIDDRSRTKQDRKIFDDSEGEYVEFEEVK